MPLRPLVPLPANPQQLLSRGFNIKYFPVENTYTDSKWKTHFYFTVSFNNEVRYFPHNPKHDLDLIPKVQTIYQKLTGKELEYPRSEYDKQQKVILSNFITNNSDLDNEVIALMQEFGKKSPPSPFLNGGSRHRRRPSRKYKKSAKRVFRKKSRSTRRR